MRDMRWIRSLISDRKKNVPEDKGVPTELVAQIVRALAADSTTSPQLWQAFHDALSKNYDAFSAALGRYTPKDQLIHLVSLLLIAVVRNAFSSAELRDQLFALAEQMGVHILPVHFYSPVPDTTTLRSNYASRRFDDPASSGWSLNEAGQLALVDELSQYAGELAEIPETSTNGFSWENPAITASDAALYYCMIRHFRPRRVIEVGSGYSTLIAARACLRNGSSELISIDPFPPPFLTPAVPGVTRLVRAPAQELEPSFFASSLGPGDILFIDSTHVSKADSDVNHLLLSVVPRLANGSIVHFHDIFLPWDYAESWIKEKHIFWNEQYLLLAFLLFNKSYQVLLGSQFLGRQHGEYLHRRIPYGRVPGGGSFWIRKMA